MYGYCPICYSKTVKRERRLNGDDTCENNHTYPSKDTLRSLDEKEQFLYDLRQVYKKHNVIPLSFDETIYFFNNSRPSGVLNK